MSMARSESCTAKAWAILLVVFLGGAASGVLGVRVLAPERPPDGKLVQNPAPVDPIIAVDHLAEELRLSQDQTEQVRGILDHCIMQEAELMKQIDQIKKQGRDQISKALSEPQRTKFQAMLLEASTN